MITTELITGNTYPVKNQIKALGGTWNRACQGWNVPAANAEAARQLVAAAGPSTYEPRQRLTVTRFASGATSYQNTRGRCEDAPCCGCCS